MGHYLSEMTDPEPAYIPETLGKIKQRMKKIPLETRLYVMNDMAILSYLVDNGFIPDGFWTDEKEKKYGKNLHKFAKKLAKFQIQKMKQWEKDGRPQKTKKTRK